MHLALSHCFVVSDIFLEGCYAQGFFLVCFQNEPAVAPGARSPETNGEPQFGTRTPGPRASRHWGSDPADQNTVWHDKAEQRGVDR